MDELKINGKPTKINEEPHFVSLEQAITEGGSALIPYEFEYPNTNLIVEVKLKPITNPELTSIAQASELSDSSLDIELLKVAIFNTDGTSFEKELLEKLPAGVVMELAYKILDISGMDIDELSNRQSTVSQLPGF